MEIPLSNSCPITKEDAIGDIIESVAMMEKSLAHILNAESEKLQLVISLPNLTPEHLLATNHSIKVTISSISRLEMILLAKLEVFCVPTCNDTSDFSDEKQKPKYLYTQQINDLIESVALQEAALANISNAEGAKIQRFIILPEISQQTLLCLNKSVTDTIDSINILESILKQKLNTITSQFHIFC